MKSALVCGGKSANMLFTSLSVNMLAGTSNDKEIRLFSAMIWRLDVTVKKVAGLYG